MSLAEQKVSGKTVLSAVALLSFAGSLAACGRQPLTSTVGSDDGPGPSDASDAVCADAGSTDAGAPAAIPLGVYTACASRAEQAGSTADGSGGMIALTATGGVLTVEVRKGFVAFGTGTLAFTPITSSAAVAAPGQMYRPSNIPCKTSTVELGALALEGGELALSLVGQGCGEDIGATLHCLVPADATETLTAPAPPCSPAGPPGCGCAPPAFAVGAYGHCTASIPVYEGGTTTVTQSEDVVTAAFDGLTNIAPTSSKLRFTPTTKATATIVAGQTWVVLVSGLSTPFVPATMTVTSGTLVVDGSTLFAFVTGMDADHNDLREAFHCAGN